MTYVVRKPHYIKKHVCQNKVRGLSYFYNERQARAVVLETLFCENVLSFGIKKTGPRVVSIVKVKKRFNFPVGTRDGKTCNMVLVLYVDCGDDFLEEEQSITAYPVI